MYKGIILLSLSLFLLPSFVFAQTTYPQAGVYQNTSTTTITDGNFHNIFWDTEEYDTTAFFDSQTGRFNPKLSGYYLVGGGIYCNGGTYCQVGINKNGGTTWIGNILRTDGGNNRAQVQHLIFLNGTTDYVQLQYSTDATQILGGQGQSHAYVTFIESSLSTTSTSIVYNPSQNLFNGIILFFVAMVFVVWYFRGRLIQ